MSTITLDPVAHGRPGGRSLPPGRPRGSRWGRAAALRSLLRLPLFSKLLVANGAIVVLAVVAVHWLDVSWPSGASRLFPLIVTIGLGAILAGNAIIVWVALAPLRSLQHVAARVSSGDLDARVPDTPLADREMRRLVQTFNAGLAAAARQRQRLRGLQLRGSNAAEAERERVAMQLHDGAAQALTALRIRTRLALASEDSQLRHAVLLEVNEGIGDVVHDLRDVAARLRPLGLHLLGLGAAIESCARSMLRDDAVELIVDKEDVQGLLSQETELVLFRVAEEALSNVARHAAAVHVSITLRRVDDDISLTIRDDGIGFDPNATEVNEFGIFEMQERVSAAGGRFELETAPGKGVRIHVLIPVECKAHVR